MIAIKSISRDGFDIIVLELSEKFLAFGNIFLRFDPLICFLHIRYIFFIVFILAQIII